MAESLELLSVEDLAECIIASGVSIEAVENIRKHDISGEIFMSMDNEDIKEIAPKMSDKVRLKKLQGREAIATTCNKVRSCVYYIMYRGIFCHVLVLVHLFF